MIELVDSGPSPIRRFDGEVAPIAVGPDAAQKDRLIDIRQRG